MGELLQLAIYRVLIRDLYPALPIRSFLIGLDGPRWLEPSDDELDAALALLARASEGDLPLFA